MIGEIEELSKYLDKILNNPQQDVERPKIKEETIACLLEKIDKMYSYLKEIDLNCNQMAEGNLKFQIQKNNYYASSLKDLQASLKNLLWQINRIAIGDYQVNVDYLGDFTVSFKNLIKQLKERETVLKENTRLSEALAQQQMQLLENELERSSEKYNQFAKSMAEIRSYRHDMQNHLLCIHSLLQSKDYQGAENYIQSLTDIFTSIDQSEQSQNFILDALLNDKLGKAKELNIKVEKKVSIYRRLNIDNKDWCILIGNALDNCLEALVRVPVEDRELSIKLIHSENMLSVQIANSISELPIIIKDEISTSKEDKNNHGIGLKNIEKTVQKYHGEMKIKTDNKIFYLIFILFDV